MFAGGSPLVDAYNLLRASFRTFSGNEAELETAATRLLDDLADKAGQLRDETETARLNREVGRAFFNWLASVAALIEHTRGGVIPIVRQRGAPFVDEYDRRRAPFNEPPLRLVREMRNYASHATLPVIFSSLRRDMSLAPTAKLLLAIDALQRHSHWPAPVRDYVASLDSDLELLTLVPSYAHPVRELYGWLGPTMLAWCRSELPDTALRDWDS